MSSPQRNKLSVIVAHQWRINVAQAGIFLRVFYEALARGEDVDSAVQAFRTQSTSWALPVVFLGDANAKVFAPTANDPYPLDLGQYLGPYEFFVQQHRVTDRRFLRDAIEDFAGSLIREKKGGIFHLLGPPGFGKTSFLWSYVNRSPDKPPHFAYRAGNSLLPGPGGRAAASLPSGPAVRAPRREESADRPECISEAADGRGPEVPRPRRSPAHRC